MSSTKHGVRDPAQRGRTGFNQCAACNDGYTLTSESTCQLGSENWASNTKVVRASARQIFGPWKIGGFWKATTKIVDSIWSNNIDYEQMNFQWIGLSGNLNQRPCLFLPPCVCVGLLIGTCWVYDCCRMWSCNVKFLTSFCQCWKGCWISKHLIKPSGAIRFGHQLMQSKAAWTSC